MDIVRATSVLGTLLQTAGVILIGVLVSLLARSVRRGYVTEWAIGWGVLGLALLSLYLAFQIPALSWGLESLYFLGEYAFGYLLYAGARRYVLSVPPARADLWLVPVALVVAILLPRVSPAFSLCFAAHSPIFAACFGVTAWRLRGAESLIQGRLGYRVMRMSLILLTVDFLQYAPVLFWASKRGIVLPFAYGSFTPIYDFILEALLALGMVTFVLEDVNHDLRVAHDRIANAARVDPLTQSLNRHAFYSLLEEDRASSPRGTVVILDLDNLKQLNDTLGHASGDYAIRSVAAAVRGLVRAGDLVFRWGGDEFLLLLPGVSLEEADRRFSSLDQLLREVKAPGSSTSFVVRVSSGAAAFGDGVTIERAIQSADLAMYGRKQARKTAAS